MMVETNIRDTRNNYLPLLRPSLGDRVAKLELAMYIDMILRCLFSKPWPCSEPKVNLPVGRLSVEKFRSWEPAGPKLWTLGILVWALQFPQGSWRRTRSSKRRTANTLTLGSLGTLKGT